jgi:hypothetical protein
MALQGFLKRLAAIAAAGISTPHPSAQTLNLEP